MLKFQTNSMLLVSVLFLFKKCYWFHFSFLQSKTIVNFTRGNLGFALALSTSDECAGAAGVSARRDSAGARRETPGAPRASAPPHRRHNAPGTERIGHRRGNETGTGGGTRPGRAGERDRDRRGGRRTARGTGWAPGAARGRRWVAEAGRAPGVRGGRGPARPGDRTGARPGDRTARGPALFSSAETNVRKAATRTVPVACAPDGRAAALPD